MELPRFARQPQEGATATEKGWVSKTGELIVSHKNLKSKIDALVGVKAKVEKTVVEEVEAVEEVKTAPKAPARKKSKKGKTTFSEKMQKVAAAVKE